MMLAFFLAVVASSAPPSVDACISASEAAQKHKKAGRFLVARDQFLVCTQAACPPIIQKDCEAQLEDVRRLVPSMVVSLRDAQGQDIVDAAVLIDQKQVADKLTGQLLEQEAGEHLVAVRFGQQTLQRKVVLQSGDRARRVQFQLPASPVIGAEIGPQESSSTVPIVLASAGAVALASFITLGAVGLSKRSKLANSDCGLTKTCSSEQTKGTRQVFLAADISLVVAAVLGGSALAVWLLD